MKKQVTIITHQFFFLHSVKIKSVILNSDCNDYERLRKEIPDFDNF